MKVYNKIVIDMDSNETLEEDFFDYPDDQPLALCLSVGGGSSNSYSQMMDPIAARRMADVAERQAAIGEQQWQYYLNTFQPYETALATSNKALIPYNEALAREAMKAETSLIPERTAATSAALQSIKKEVQASDPVAAKFYEQALKGVDVKERMSQGAATVAQQFDNSRGELTRNMSRMGVTPGSGASFDTMNRFGIERAKAVGGAMTSAKNAAETENFARLAAGTSARNNAMSLGATGVPYSSGTLNQGGYQLTSPAQTALEATGQAITANQAGFGTTYRSSGRNYSFGIF